MSISINYHREGEGPPVVLLHGVGLHWQVWGPVIDLLARDFDVIACDSPGFGRSPALPEGVVPTIAAYADAFEWFFAELGLEKPHVAGNSMGGGIALELARGGTVSSVSAFSPVGFWTAPEIRFCQLSLGALDLVPDAARGAMDAMLRTRAGRKALLSQYFAKPQEIPPQEIISMLADWRAAPARRGVLEAFSEYRFGSPEQLRNRAVTIAWGARDRLLPYRLQAPRARALLPWATHVTLGTGHVPSFDDPAAVAAVVRASAQRAVQPQPVR